jgi:hypothetical protein
VRWGLCPGNPFSCTAAYRFSKTAGKRHEESEVRHCWCEVWHHIVGTRLNSLGCIPHQGRDRLTTQQTEVNSISDCTIDELRTEYSDTRYAHHTVNLCGCGGFAAVSLRLSETENRTFCLLMQPYKWKWVSSRHHVTFKTLGLSCNSRSTHSQKRKRLAVQPANSGWLSCILYENDKSTRQIFDAVLVETRICSILWGSDDDVSGWVKKVYWTLSIVR